MSEARIQASFFEYHHRPELDTPIIEVSRHLTSAARHIGYAALEQHTEVVDDTEQHSVLGLGIDLSKYVSKIEELDGSNTEHAAKIEELKEQIRTIIEGNTYDDIVLSDSLKMDVFRAAFDTVNTTAGEMNLANALSAIDSYSENVRNGSRSTNMSRLRKKERVATGMVKGIFREVGFSLSPVFDEYEVPEEQRATRTERIIKQTLARYSGAALRLERTRLEDATGVTARRKALEEKRQEDRRRVLEIYE